MTITCTFCSGTGKVFAPTARTCSVCHGVGKIDGYELVDEEDAAELRLNLKERLHSLNQGLELNELQAAERDAVDVLALIKRLRRAK